MTAQPTHARPAAILPLRQLIARYPLTAFLVLTYTLVLASMAPLLLSRQGFGVVPVDLPLRAFQIIASFVGLALPPFLVTAATDGRAGVQELLRRCLRWRVGLHWYLLALFGMLAGVLILALPFFGIAPLQRLAVHGELLASLVLPGVLIPFLLINLPEELAWAGLLQARLQERHGPVLASLLTAPAFALVHLPPFFVDGWINERGSSLAELPSVLLTVAFLAVFAIFFRIVMAWLYNSSGSLLIVSLSHTTFNLINGQQLTPRLIPDPSAVGLLPLSVIVVLAVSVAVATKGRIGYKPEGSGASIVPPR